MSRTIELYSIHLNFYIFYMAIQCIFQRIENSSISSEAIFFFFYVFNMYRVFLHSIGRRNFIFQWVHIISQKLPIFRAFICNTFIFSLEFTINGIESFAEEKNEPHVQYLYYLIIEISVWINVKKIFCLIVSFKWRSIFNKLKIFNNL